MSDSTSVSTSDRYDVSLEDVGDVGNLSSDEIRAFATADLPAIRAANAPAETALRAFFTNRVTEALKMLAECESQDPISMLASATIAFVVAVLSMEPAKGKEAAEKLSLVATFAKQIQNFKEKKADQQMPAGGDKRTSSLGVFRAAAIYNDAQTLRSFVMILSQSLPAVLKAGWILRGSYKQYHVLYKEREERAKSAADGGKDPYDVTSTATVELGLGALNVALSMIPSEVSGILSVLGFKGDREFGMKLLRDCENAGAPMIFPLASAFLLSIQGALCSFCPIQLSVYEKEMRQRGVRVVEHEETKESVLHLWLAGRNLRFFRDFHGSTTQLKECLRRSEHPQLQASLPQLRAFALFEMSFNYIILEQWKPWAAAWAELRTISKWSRIFYVYAEACIYEMLSRSPPEKTDAKTLQKHRDTASQLYWAAAHEQAANLGGKVSQVDEFAMQRLGEIFDVCGVPYPNRGNKKAVTPSKLSPPAPLVNAAPLPALEIALAMQMATQIPPELTETVVQTVDAELAAYLQGLKKGVDPVTVSLAREANLRPVPSVEDAAVTKAAVLPQGYRLAHLLGLKAKLLACSASPTHRAAAELLLAAILAVPVYKEKDCSLSYLHPSLSFDQAMLKYYDGDEEGCLKDVKQVAKTFKGKKYFFRGNINFSITLTEDTLSSK